MSLISQEIKAQGNILTKALKGDYHGYLDDPTAPWPTPLMAGTETGELFIYEGFISEEECDIIADQVLEHQDEVKALGEDRYQGTLGDNSLTGRYYIYNWLENQTIRDIIYPKLKLLFGKRAYAQVWCNVYGKGEYIMEHSHGDPSRPNQTSEIKTGWTCSTLFLRGPTDVGTWFARKKLENVKGDLVCFNSNLAHFVPKNPYDELRITMAIDIHYVRENPTWVKLI